MAICLFRLIGKANFLCDFRISTFAFGGFSSINRSKEICLTRKLGDFSFVKDFNSTIFPVITALRMYLLCPHSSYGFCQQTACLFFDIFNRNLSQQGEFITERRDDLLKTPVHRFTRSGSVFDFGKYFG